MRWAGGRPPRETRREKSLGGGGRASEERAAGGAAGGGRGAGPLGGKEPGEGAAAGRERRCLLPLPATRGPAATAWALLGQGGREPVAQSPQSRVDCPAPRGRGRGAGPEGAVLRLCPSRATKGYSVS